MEIFSGIVVTIVTTFIFKIWHILIKYVKSLRKNIPSFEDELQRVKENKYKEEVILVQENGKEEKIEVLAFFELHKTGHEVLIYTKNKKIKNGDVEVILSEVVEGESGLCLKELNDEDYALALEVMEEIILAADGAEELN